MSKYICVVCGSSNLTLKGKEEVHCNKCKSTYNKKQLVIKKVSK